jgi:uncharacterized membrane protein
MNVKREVSRVEGFSDAVFGFALTLLVVSLEVPEDIEGLKATLSGFLPFAATFAIICWIWFEHYLFFRRVGAEDGRTIVLNCALLFVVLFYVYPMKYVFSRIIPEFRFEPMSGADARLLMASYSAGVVAVFMIFVLMYWNALRSKELKLSPGDLFDARTSMRRHIISAGVGLASVILTFVLPVRFVGLAGLMYALQGPIHAVHGYLSEKARAKTAL